MAVNHFLIEGDRFDSKGNHKENIKVEVSYPSEGNVVLFIVLDDTARKLIARFSVPKDQLLDALAQAT